MKQRIEELVNQSKFFANDERRYLERVHNREYSQDEWQDICFEKFANLIVRECADLCDRFQARDVGMQPAECAGAIRKMFGVEE